MPLQVEIGNRNFYFHRPADLETLWEKMTQEDCGTDQRIPYWVEIWPASILLSRWIFDQQEQISGKWCLDLGCGLGLSACAAASCSARVVAMDYEWPALWHAKYNSYLNRTPEVDWIQMDWRQPALKPRVFSFIWGAEIIYEARFFSPLIQLFAQTLAPEGKIWLAMPERDVSLPFWDKLGQNNWKFKTVTEQAITFAGCNDMRVQLMEIHRGS